jgi:hypothetical protein
MTLLFEEVHHRKRKKKGTPFVVAVAISCYEINRARDDFLFGYLNVFSSCWDLVFQASLDLGDFDLWE